MQNECDKKESLSGLWNCIGLQNLLNSVFRKETKMIAGLISALCGIIALIIWVVFLLKKEGQNRLLIPGAIFLLISIILGILSAWQG